MGVLEGITDLRHDGERFPGGKSSGVEELAQIHAIDKFHEEKDQSVRRPEFVEGDDVGMVEPGQRLGFTGKAIGKRAIATNAGRENLQRDDPVQFLLPRLVNRAHATAADQSDDLELREFHGKLGGGLRIEGQRFAAAIEVGGKRRFQQALRAKSLRRAGCQRFATAWTSRRRLHIDPTLPTSGFSGECYRSNGPHRGRGWTRWPCSIYRAAEILSR